jgi:hypothetical protein
MSPAMQAASYFLGYMVLIIFFLILMASK